MSATAARVTLSQQRQGAFALAALKVSVLGCTLALVGTLGSVAWKAAGL